MGTGAVPDCRADGGSSNREVRDTSRARLDPGFEVAMEKAFGCDIRQARRAVTQEHPLFGIVQTSEPALRAQQIEKRVREVWMRNGRP
jgi:hypothetical protein